MIVFEEVLLDPIHEMFYDLIWIICTYNGLKACVLVEIDLFLNLLCVSIIRIDLKPWQVVNRSTVSYLVLSKGWLYRR